MTTIVENGYFENGAFKKGLHPSMIGKKIIRTTPCSTPYGADYSHCLNGKYFEQPDDWVILKGITPDGKLIVEWMKWLFDHDHILEEYWNDGNWVRGETMYEHKPFVKQLTGHTSEETAFVVEDYPYGFTLRTSIRYWIETTKHGQRNVSQTKNPKNGRWNTPKKSTYSLIAVMGLDEKGYVTFDGIGVYASLDEARKFNSCFALNPEQQKFIGALIGACEITEKWRAERELTNPN